LAADMATYGGANQELIWTAFAKRGMGLNATDGGGQGSTAVSNDFEIPDFGMRVVSSTPSANSIIMTTPTSFVIDFSGDYVPGTVEATDLEVNGVPADGFTQTDLDTVTFTYLTSPVTNEGLQTMFMASNALVRASDSAALREWDESFRYDALRMMVTSTVPADGSVITLPLTNLILEINEPVDTNTVDIGDISLNQGVALAASASGPSTLSYDLSGINAEGQLTLNVPAGVWTDPNGNPNLPYSGSFTTDYGTVEYPLALQPVDPLGSIVYDPAVPASISFDGDTDSFTLELNENQTLSVVVIPDPGLLPTIDVFDPDSGFIAGVAAPAAGSNAVVQTAPVLSNGTYTVTVGGSPGQTGPYTVQVIVNAALELEEQNSSSNNT
ncbi:MAG: Ig-like domain-containing protein, partial [Verrucomicrobiota bacterium]